MKRKEAYLLLAVIWGLGAWAWTANVMRYAKVGTLNGFHITAAACSVVCVVLNLLIYFRKRKEEK